MKRFTTLMIYATVSLLVIGLGAAAAQGFGTGQGKRGSTCDGPRGEMRLERMAEHLELTEAQTEAIAALHEAGREKAQDLRKEMLRLENELEGEMLKDDPSEKAVLDLNQKMGDLRTKMHAERISLRFAVREELTEAQRDKMLSQGGHGRRGGKGGPYGRTGCDKGQGRGTGHSGCGQRGSNR